MPDRDGRLETKDVVLGVQLNDSYKAYPVAALQERRIVNDVVGGEGVLVLGSAASQGARAYYRGDRVFELPVDDNGGDFAELPSVISDADGRNVAGDGGISGQHGGRVGYACTDTHAHVVLVWVVPVSLGHGALYGALTRHIAGRFRVCVKGWCSDCWRVAKGHSSLVTLVFSNGAFGTAQMAVGEGEMVGFDSTKEYKRRRFNPCSTYADCMEELKKRVSFVNGFLTAKCSAMYVKTTSESVCLQIRKILELIALGSLCVNRTE